jgi:tetratricopeptide (TPR) repeat protein
MSRRLRIGLLVGIAALVAAGAVVAGAVLLGDDSTASPQPSGAGSTEVSEPQAPALELAVIDRDDPQAGELRRAEGEYERGDPEAALRRFERILRRDPASIEAAIGAAVAAWPDGTREKLEEIAAANPSSGVALLNLGLARLSEGDLEGAKADWQQALEQDPDSPAALRAEDLLNPTSPPGRPQFFVGGTYPADVASMGIDDRMAALQKRARRANTARAWLLLGTTLEQAGHRIGAQRAYDRAAKADPKSVDAKVAAAVARFEKGSPAKAFSRLGPLSERYPDAAVVRYHLGLLLLWLPNLQEARRQLTLARDAAPDGYYGRQADRLLDRLEGLE